MDSTTITQEMKEGTYLLSWELHQGKLFLVPDESDFLDTAHKAEKGLQLQTPEDKLSMEGLAFSWEILQASTLFRQPWAWTAWKMVQHFLTGKPVDIHEQPNFQHKFWNHISAFLSFSRPAQKGLHLVDVDKGAQIPNDHSLVEKLFIIGEGDLRSQCLRTLQQHNHIG
jgi:hypothetical protein